MVSKVFADGVPDEKGIFQGLAQAPLHFHNAIAELIDNAIAAKQEKFNIHVDLSESEATGIYYATVIDDCFGISLQRLKNHVFKVGKLPPPGSPHLREHGFGLKNVLSKVEAVKGTWQIWTRDEEAMKKTQCYFVKGPLRYEIPIQIFSSKEWPSYGPKNSGTIVRLKLPFSYLQTVTRGIRGRPPTTIGGIVNYLKEHLGVFYRGYIEGKKPIGTITISINWGSAEEVEPVIPDYKTRNTVSKIIVRTKKGKIYIEGEYGQLEPNSLTTRNRLYYYKNSPESQGVDFRIGNRVVATRLLTEIWLKPRHPTLNPFCGEFKVQPIKGRIPKTLNNKTSIDFDDEVWLDIAAAIRNKIPLPKWRGARTEAELRGELAAQLNAHKRPGDVIQQNYPCFGGAGVVIDICRDETKRTGELIIYETKSGKAHPIDVYQLKLYWDGLVVDGRQPTAAILVAKDWTTGVKTVVNFVNSLKDRNGKNYQLELKKWDDFGISPL
jgi:hypothetical protein